MKIAMLLLVAFSVLLTPIEAICASHYEVQQRHLLGGEGRWDALTFDPAHHRLFISRETHVMVVDPTTGKQLADIPDTPGVHAIALAPDLGKGFITVGRANKVIEFDAQSLKVLSTIEVGAKPDLIVYEPASHRVFSFNGGSNDATAIDAKTGKVIGTVPLGGKPEFPALDGKGHIFVNVENTGEIAEIDAAKLNVLQRWAMKGCEEPSGLAFDAAHSVLFSGCSNKTLFVVDSQTGKTITQLPIGERVDGVAYDPGRQLAFSSNGDGTLTVIGRKGKSYEVVQNVTTQRGARTLALDDSSHTVYLVTADFEPPQPDKPDARPVPKAGSFTLLTVSQK